MSWIEITLMMLAVVLAAYALDGDYYDAG